MLANISRSLFLFLLFIGLVLYLLRPVPTKSYAIQGSELLTNPWVLKANRLSVERYQLVDPNALIGKKILRLIYNLNGACLLKGDASAIIFDQPFGRTWRYISLSKYAKNCFRGEQSVDIPLSDFKGLELNKPVGTFHIRIWHFKPYHVEIKSAVLYNPETEIVGPNNVTFGSLITPYQTPVPGQYTAPTLPFIGSVSPFIEFPSVTVTEIPTPAIVFQTPVPTPTVTSQPLPSPSIVPAVTVKASWSIQSVSSMKETKDRICNQRNESFIDNWVNAAYELGVNYIALETPYENPLCGNSLVYTGTWIKYIRGKNLKIWHRHMPLAFEGIYDVLKNPQVDNLKIIHDYIVNNPGFFAEGDIFTPIPEPQNGGVKGITYCAQNICQFQSAVHFNSWLRMAMDISEQAFSAIGLSGKIKIGYFGFDGFVAWGDNNPDWNGILEDATILKMGNITIDHYPEIVGDTMENDLNELEARYPNIPIIIGEWGTISGSDTENQVLNSMKAAKRSSVVGFNYWHLGSGGKEALITDTFVKNKQYDEVRKFFVNSDNL